MAASPPYYVLLSHSALSSSSNASANPPPTLAHPTIQYQFRDDPPLSLPASQHVLVMDYDPSGSVHVQSLSPQLAVTSVKVTDAPGTVGEDDEPKNTKMYVLETVAHSTSDKGTEKPVEDLWLPVVSLTSFTQRNALLRKALEYPLPSAATPAGGLVGSGESPRPSPSRPTAALPPNSPAA